MSKENIKLNRSAKAIFKHIKNDDADNLLVALEDHKQILENAKATKDESEDWAGFRIVGEINGKKFSFLNAIWHARAINCFRCLLDEASGQPLLNWILNDFSNTAKLWQLTTPTIVDFANQTVWDSLMNAPHKESYEWWAAAKNSWLYKLEWPEDGDERLDAIITMLSKSHYRIDDSEILVALEMAGWISIDDVNDVLKETLKIDANKGIGLNIQKKRFGYSAINALSNLNKDSLSIIESRKLLDMTSLTGIEKEKPPSSAL